MAFSSRQTVWKLSWRRVGGGMAGGEVARVELAIGEWQPDGYHRWDANMARVVGDVTSDGIHSVTRLPGHM